MICSGLLLHIQTDAQTHSRVTYRSAGCLPSPVFIECLLSLSVRRHDSGLHYSITEQLKNIIKNVLMQTPVVGLSRGTILVRLCASND